MRYFKPAEFPSRVLPCDLFIANEAANFGILNRFLKLFQCEPVTFGCNLDPPVRQIAHRSSNVESARDRFDCITKPHALHASGIKNLQAFAIHLCPFGPMWPLA